MRDLFRGCLLGVAVGDALGAPFEGMEREDVQNIYTGRMMGREDYLRPGEYTDDTGMTIVLAESIVENGGRVVAEDLARRFSAWYSTGPKGVGLLTSTVLDSIGKGVPWEEASRGAWERSGGRSAGNGSVMRTAPVALAHYEARDGLRETARVVSRLTHWDPRCTDACAALCWLTVLLMDGLEPPEALGGTLTHVENGDVRRSLVRGARARREDLVSSGFVLHTLEVAVWSLMNAATFRECVGSCILLGGDTDTAGAVCGALAGARFGASSIPEEWVSPLDVNPVGAEGVLALADALHDTVYREAS